MIVILKPHPDKEKLHQLSSTLEGYGVTLHVSEGAQTTIIGLVGDTSRVDIDLIRANELVENVTRVSEPFKAANRKFHPDDTHIPVEGRLIGEGTFHVIAGPCSVESEEQIIGVAQAVKRSGATFLRGGAFKPRTSPYACLLYTSRCV